MEKSKNQLATKLKSLEKKMAGKDYSSKVCEMFFAKNGFFAEINHENFYFYVLNVRYLIKVPENVQTADKEKCESLKIEIAEMEKAINGVKNMLN